jgi:hypothetical protein
VEDLIMSIIELVETVGIPIATIPELSMFFVWNESTSLFLYQEYGDEIEQIDIRVINFDRRNSGKLGCAIALAKNWADEIRQEEKSKNEG